MRKAELGEPRPDALEHPSMGDWIASAIDEELDED